MHRLNKTIKPPATKRMKMLQYQMHMMAKINITREEKLMTQARTRLTFMPPSSKDQQRTPRKLPSSARTQLMQIQAQQRTTRVLPGSTKDHLKAQDQQRTARTLPSSSQALQRTSRTLPSSTRTRPMLRAKDVKLTASLDQELPQSAA